MKKQAFRFLPPFDIQTSNSKLQTPNFKLFLFSFLLSPLSLFSQLKIQLQDYASGFTRPVDIAHCGDSRLFVVEQTGYIWTLDSLGNRLPEAFLDIDARVRSTGNEQGLLGLAFPPDYAATGWFYVNYTRETDGDTRVSRFSRDALNPDKADPNSELILFTQDQPFPNHNGGCMKFGPDGYLYIGLGDGGSGGDPQGNGQKKNTFLGKILRIDVKNSSMTQPYAVPANNPFVSDAAYRPEIWSLGWRNPWRFSFDRLTGDMWVGDVGQGSREEIDFEPVNTPGLNYGWRCYEGTAAYNTAGCLPANNYTGPIFDYTHSSANGCSVTGGFVYRGTKYPGLYGCYLFADYCSGRWWLSRRNADGTFTTSVLANLAGYEYSSFGEDRNGELYVCLLDDGKIQKVNELCSSFQIVPATVLSPVCTGSFSGAILLNTNGGAAPVNYVWSNGQSGAVSSLIYLNPGSYSVTATDANGCVRSDTFIIEQTGPGLPVLAAGDTVLCPGQSVLLTASMLPEPNQLDWYLDGQIFTTTTSSSGTFSLAVSEAGYYSVQLFDSVCLHLQSQQVWIKEETGVPPAEIAVFADTLVAADGWEAYQWFFNGAFIAGATDRTYLALEPGLYVCQFTSPAGCIYTDSAVVTMSGTALPPSVLRFSLAPNPARDMVYLTLELEQKEHISLILNNIQQQQIFRQSYAERQLSLPLDLRNLPAGTYFLTVQTDRGRFTEKFLKP